MQTVSDAQMRIIDVVARWPGSTHDQLIFNNCALKHRFEGGEFNECVLLGDSGYQNKFGYYFISVYCSSNILLQLLEITC